MYEMEGPHAVSLHHRCRSLGCGPRCEPDHHPRRPGLRLQLPGSSRPVGGPISQLHRPCRWPRLPGAADLPVVPVSRSADVPELPPVGPSLAVTSASCRRFAEAAQGLSTNNFQLFSHPQGCPQNGPGYPRNSPVIHCLSTELCTRYDGGRRPMKPRNLSTRWASSSTSTTSPNGLPAPRNASGKVARAWSKVVCTSSSVNGTC